MNGWKVDPKEIIRLIAPLRPSPLPITQQQPFGVDENESNALCEVLNWAQEEAEKVAGWVRQELAERQGDATLGDDFACLISLLRAVGLVLQLTQRPARVQASSRAWTQCRQVG